MFTYHWFETEDRELCERVVEYLNRTLSIFGHRKAKVVESSYIMNPPSWRSDNSGECSWDHIFKWEILACFPYEIGSKSREMIDCCVTDYLAGWRNCKAQWEAHVDAQEKQAEWVRALKEKKELFKASFDPKQCLECRHRVDCLPHDVKKLFWDDRYHYHRDLHCVFEARINHWDHKGQSVIEVYDRGCTWREASRYYRSLKEEVWYTTNPRILEEMRRTVVYSEHGYRSECGVNFTWCNYNKKGKTYDGQTHPGNGG